MSKLLTPWTVIPFTLLLMAGLMYAAVCADSLRIYESTQAELAEIDAERIALEKRFFEVLGKHESGTEPFSPAKRNFRETVDRFRARPATDADRSYRDEVQGIINRWEHVDGDYRRVADELHEYSRSFRGSLAKQYASSPQTE